MRQCIENTVREVYPQCQLDSPRLTFSMPLGRVGEQSFSVPPKPVAITMQEFRTLDLQSSFELGIAESVSISSSSSQSSVFDDEKPCSLLGGFDEAVSVSSNSTLNSHIQQSDMALPGWCNDFDEAVEISSDSTVESITEDKDDLREGLRGCVWELTDALDEVVSVASDATTAETMNGSEQSDSDNLQQRSSMVAQFRALTPAERALASQYNQVLKCLHTDIDQLMLRLPFLGGAFMAILRRIAQSLRQGLETSDLEANIMVPLVDCKQVASTILQERVSQVGTRAGQDETTEAHYAAFHSVTAKAPMVTGLHSVTGKAPMVTGSHMTLPEPGSDIHLVELFAARKWLGEKARAHLLAVVRDSCQEGTEPTTSSPKQHAFVVPPRCSTPRLEPRDFQDPAAVSYNMMWTASPAESENTEPDSPLGNSLDEVISIASDATTVDSVIAEPNDCRRAHLDQSTPKRSLFTRTGSSEKNRKTIAPVPLTPAEKALADKYRSVLDALHSDMDLVVLRSPCLGGEITGLMRLLVRGFHKDLTGVASGLQGSLNQCEATLLQVLGQCEHAVSVLLSLNQATSDADEEAASSLKATKFSPCSTLRGFELHSFTASPRAARLKFTQLHADFEVNMTSPQRETVDATCVEPEPAPAPSPAHTAHRVQAMDSCNAEYSAKCCLDTSAQGRIKSEQQFAALQDVRSALDQILLDSPAMAATLAQALHHGAKSLDPMVSSRELSFLTNLIESLTAFSEANESCSKVLMTPAKPSPKASHGLAGPEAEPSPCAAMPGKQLLF